MRNLFLFSTISVLFILMWGCDPGTSEEATESPAEEINEEKFTGNAEETAEFLTELYSFNLMIKAYNDAALRQPGAPQMITDFAEQSNQYHQRMNDTISNFANQLNITLPNMVGENVADYIENITDEETDEFSEEYVDVIEDLHDRLLQTLTDAEDEEEVIVPEIRVWALSTLAEINDRDARIENLEETFDEIE